MKDIHGHAFLVPGGVEKLEAMYGFLSEHGMSIKGNPDVYVREYRNFRVDDAREIRERAMTRAVRIGAHRVFIIVTPSITTDAQNALLKVLEEPPADAVFFFVVPSPQTLLATLRSRAHVLRLEDEASAPSVAPGTFLKASIEKRIEMLKPLYTRDDEDEERDIRNALAFLSALERELSTRKNVREGLNAVYRARRFLTDKGALLKPLLEQVALLTPRT
jgi:DNA polymerase III delta prime subunit